MGDARRIRQLAAQHVLPEAIAARMKLRPATVRRVLGRSAKRGAPRKRAASETLSLVTTPELAERIRAAAASRGISVSSMLAEMVQRELLPADAARGQRSSGKHARTGSNGGGEERRGRTAAGRALTRPGDAAKKPSARRSLVTAADAPEAVRKLLKSYEPKALRWRVRDHRYEIAIAVLTRGNAEAKRWLWSVLPRGEVRELVRRYRGSGCAEPDRALLRKLLELTEVDLPTRPYLGLGARARAAE